MALSEEAAARIEEFRARVTAMRELGVQQWRDPHSDILLGPEPIAEVEAKAPRALSEDEKLEATIQKLRKHHEVMFAHTGIRIGDAELERMARLELQMQRRGLDS